VVSVEEHLLPLNARFHSAVPLRRRVEAVRVGRCSDIEQAELIDFRDAQNAENDEIAPNWNVSRTRDSQFTIPLEYIDASLILSQLLAGTMLQRGLLHFFRSRDGASLFQPT